MNNRTITTQNYIIYTKAYNKDLNGYDNKMQQASQLGEKQKIKEAEESWKRL